MQHNSNHHANFSYLRSFAPQSTSRAVRGNVILFQHSVSVIFGNHCEANGRSTYRKHRLLGALIPAPEVEIYKAWPPEARHALYEAM